MAAKSLEQLKSEATALGIQFPDDIKATDLSTLIKGKTGEVDESTAQPAAPAQTPGELPANVTFSPEQMRVINEMMQREIGGLKASQSPNNPVSMYDMRDPKKIETVNVRRFLGKFVMGFKNLQADPYRKDPKYTRIGLDPIRKLPNEPYITLLLSTDGKQPYEEKEVLLIDYMNERDTFQAKVLKIDEKEVIHNHGMLGRSGGDMGIAVDEKGNPEARPTVLAQSKTIERTFTVQLPGFETTSEFISDFLA